jgi:hypothetical protein
MFKRFNTIEEMKEYFDTLQPFKETTDIPTLPHLDEKEWKEFMIPKLIELGAIPKNQLKDGVWYYGDTRNTTLGKWNEKENNFEHWRYKFGWRWDDVNHFEDDNGYALFVPLREANEEELESIKKIEEEDSLKK